MHPSRSDVSYSPGVEALRRIEEQRKAREDRMRNALEILAEYDPAKQVLWGDIRRFVRATAREGLGRE